MTTLVALAYAPARPRAFVPLTVGAVRSAHCDPRPLWREPVTAASPWTSPTFWLASALVLPVAGLVRLARLCGNGISRR